MDGIHTGAGFGSFGSIRNTLMPSQNNLNTWLKTPTTDGKTLVNVEGTNATLTGISMTNYDGTNDFTGGTFPAGFTKVDAGTKVEFTITDLTLQGTDRAIIELGSLSGTGGNFQAAGIGIYSTFTSQAGDGELRLYVQENDATFISDRFGGTSINDGNPHTISVEFPTTSSVKYTVDGSATTVAFSAFDNASGFEGTVTALSDSFPTNGNLYTLGASRNIGGAVQANSYSTCKLSNVKISQGSDVIVDLPLAEGAGLRAFDISGNGAHGSHTGATYTTHDGIASHNHQYGFATSPITEKSAFSGTNCTGAINTDGALVVTSTANSDVAWTLGLPIQLTGSVTLTYDAVVSDGGGVACNLNLNDTGSFWATSGGSPSANIPNGSYSGTATISSDQDIGLKFNVYGHLTTGQTITFSNLSITQSDTCRLPALINNTKQGYTGDGVADNIQFAHSINASSDFEFESEFIVNDPTISLQAIFSATGSTTNDRGMFIRYEVSSTRWFIKLGDTNYTITSHTIARGDEYKFNLKYHSSTQKCTLTMTKNGTTTTPIDNQAVDNVPDFNNQASLGALRWSSSYSGFTFKTCKFIQGTTTNVELDIDNSAGLSTVADLSGNGNNGTLQSATLTLNWAKRVIDTSGTLVNCNYTGGDTSIPNPTGHVHNNSECGLDLITTDRTAAQIKAINNASATQTFAKRESAELASQILQYSSAISGGDLTRTRRYVG